MVSIPTGVEAPGEDNLPGLVCLFQTGKSRRDNSVRIAAEVNPMELKTGHQVLTF